MYWIQCRRLKIQILRKLFTTYLIWAVPYWIQYVDSQSINRYNYEIILLGILQLYWRYYVGSMRIKDSLRTFEKVVGCLVLDPMRPAQFQCRYHYQSFCPHWNCIGCIGSILLGIDSTIFSSVFIGLEKPGSPIAYSLVSLRLN